MPTKTLSQRDLAGRLRLAVMRLARRLRRQSVPGATPSMLSALSTLERVGSLTLGELAAAEGVRPPSMTRVVDRLEEEDLVTRAADTGDRRVARVALTASGRELVRRNRRRKDAYLARALANLTPAELATLDRAAGIIERILEEDR